MRRRPSQRRSSSSSLRWLWWLAGLLALVAGSLVFLGPSLVIGYIQRFVRSDDFRIKAQQMIESRLGGHTSIANLDWHDDTAAINDLSIDTDSGWQLDASGVQAALDFGAIRKGIWHVQSASADELRLKKAAPKSFGMRSPDVESSIPGWLQRYIPHSTEIDGFDAQRFFFEQLSSSGAWQIADTQLHFGAYDSAAADPGHFSVPGTFTGGTLLTPITPTQQKSPLKFDLTRATLRLSDQQFQISDAAFKWKEQSELTLRGTVKFSTGQWQTFIHASAMPLREFLNDFWQPRLTGHFSSDLELSATRDSPIAWKADISLKDSVLTALPVLDQLATYTRAERFKRVVLDIATATIRPQGSATRFEKVVVQSNGLLRIEGDLTLQGESISGDFMLGVTPETLKWIPGADSRVFVEANPKGPPGLLWTRLKIGGTVAAPQEDLSSRLLGAAGMSLLMESPGTIVNTASDTLLKPVLGEDAAKLPGKIINGTTGTLEQGVKTGTDLINKVIPLFPGK